MKTATSKIQTLFSRTGAMIRARVIVHLNPLFAGRQGCEVTLESMRAQEFPVNQTQAAWDGSDISCPHCLAAR